MKVASGHTFTLILIAVKPPENQVGLTVDRRMRPLIGMRVSIRDVCRNNLR